MSDANANISGGAESDSQKHLLDTQSDSPQRPSKIARADDPGDDEEQGGFASKTMSQNPRVQRYLVAIEYIGTRFSGSQQQLNCRTVTGVLQVGCCRN